MIVAQSRRRLLKALLGVPLFLHFWRSEAFSGAASDSCDIVIVDGWILRREDLKRARLDAT